MTQTKNAIGNLINRYKAVLGKCSLLNSVGSLAMAGILALLLDGHALASGPSNNTVVLPAGIIHNGDLIAGETTSGIASNNMVIVSGGSLPLGLSFPLVAGGYVETGTASNNAVQISGGEVFARVYGGIVNTKGDALGNTVSLSGGTIQGPVYGGYTSDGKASNNTVIFSGGIAPTSPLYVDGSIIAGYAGTGEASNNTLIINAGQFSGVDDPVGAGAVSTGTASNNTLLIYGGNIGDPVFGGLVESTGLAKNNLVVVSGGTIIESVAGGQVRAGNAVGNTVLITGGTLGTVGERCDIYGGQSMTKGDASDNLVQLLGGVINGNVIGGMTGNINKNGSVANGNGVAVNNTVDYRGGTVLGSLWGGYGTNGKTNNTLISVDNRSVGQDISYFQNYLFVLGANNFGLTAGGTFYMDPATNRLLHLDALGGGNTFNVGDRLTLVQAGQPVTGAGITEGQTGRGKKGATLFFDYAVDPINTVPNSLTATVTGVQVNPQAKALSEGVAASMAFLNMGADAVASAGMASALASTAGVFPTGTTTFAPFGTMQFGSSRIDTGSHVDVTGLNLIAGIALGQQTEFGKFLVGPFFEAGFGTYSTYNSFDNAASVYGEGRTNFLGAGLLARFDSSDIALGHLYLEGSFRFGHAFHDYDTDDLKDVLGNTANYDTDSPYQSFHAGLGYIFNLTESDHLDVYGKYFWSHLGSSDVRVVGDPIEFYDVHSSRLRFGGRYSHDFGTDSGYSFSPYIGAAYEHEFDGKVRATTYGYRISAPSLTGDTGVGELGVTFRHQNGLSLDLGVSGHVGKRQGVAGNMLLKYEF